jgi:hypothetical protein
MASSEQIPDAELRSIARQIADRAPARAMAAWAAAPATRLAESFPIWALTPDAVGRTRDMAEAATPTGDWHHQIRAPGGATGFARSRVTEGKWRVDEVAGSGAERDIEASIGWIDEHLPQALDARLLIAPAYYLTSFWLHGPGEDHVVVVQAPAALRNLERNVDYPGREFLARLADNRPSTGVPALPKE